MRMHDIVESVASDEPPLRHSIDDVVAAGRRAERRRRVGWATAALTAVAVTAAVGLPYLVRHQPAPGMAAVPAAASSAPAQTTFAAPAPPFTFTFTGYDAGPLHVDSPLVVSTAYQIAAVHGSGPRTNDTRAPRLFAYLIVYRPGAYKPNGTRNATVAGRPAIEQALPNNGGMHHRLLAWQYIDGAWATLDSYSSEAANPSAKDLRAVAVALKPAPPTAARLPFTMRYVPAGFRPVVVGSHVMAGLDGIAAAGEGDFGGVVFARPAPSPTGLTMPWNETGGAGIPGSFEIFIVPNSNSNQALKPGQQPPAQPRCGHGICNAWSADGAVDIQIAREGNAISDAEMTKVLNGITLATVSNDATWPDASMAIPVGP